MTRSMPNIRQATPDDVAGMASCHLEGFPETATSRMGSRWVEHLYSYYIQAERGIAIVATGVDGGIDGVAVGGDRRIPQSYRRSCVRKFPLALVWRTMTDATVRRPVILAARELVKGRKREKSIADLEIDARAGLLSICMRQRARGTGVADDLMVEFESECWKMGFSKIQLGVRVENTRARSFYEKSGWTVHAALSDSAVHQYQKHNCRSED